LLRGVYPEPVEGLAMTNRPISDFLRSRQEEGFSKLMNISTQRKIDRLFGKPICRFLSLISSRGKSALPAGKSAKILVILLSEMGSLVLAIPMFDRLKEKYPECELYALCFDRNREFLEILDLVPSGNILTVRGESVPGLAIDTLRLVSRLRRENIDVVLDCELFSRVSSIYAFFSGAGI